MLYFTEDPSRDGFISSSSEILKEQIGSKRPRYELTSKTSPQHGGHQSNEVPSSSKVPNDDGIIQSKKLRYLLTFKTFMKRVRNDLRFLLLELTVLNKEVINRIKYLSTNQRRKLSKIFSILFLSSLKIKILNKNISHEIKNWPHFTLRQLFRKSP